MRLESTDGSDASKSTARRTAITSFTVSDWACASSAAAVVGEAVTSDEGGVIVSVTTFRAASHAASLSNSERSPPEPVTKTTPGRFPEPGGTRR